MRAKIRISHVPLWGTALALAAAGLLSGCSASGFIADRTPAIAGGLPEGAPERPAETASFPAVHDMPPLRPETPMTEEERNKLEKELVATRTKQEQLTQPEPPPSSPPKKPAAKAKKNPLALDAPRADGTTRNP